MGQLFLVPYPWSAYMGNGDNKEDLCWSSCWYCHRILRKVSRAEVVARVGSMDPYRNAEMAYEIFLESGWQPWVV